MPKTKKIICLTFAFLCLFLCLTSKAIGQPHAKKIVSLNLCADELLLSLADADRISALTYFSQDPKASSVSKEAKKFPAIKGQIEEVLALEPDLIIAGVFTDPMMVHSLKELGFWVEVIKVPRHFDDIRSNIRQVAKALGVIERGETLILKMNQGLSEIKKDKGRAQRVLFYQIGGYTPGKDTFENAIIEAAGAVNLAAELGVSGHGTLSLEELILGEPDSIIISSDARDNYSVRRAILEHPAIEEGMGKIKKINLPSNLINCGNPNSVKAVQQLVLAMREKV